MQVVVEDDVPSPLVVVVFCHIYLPSTHAGAVVLQPDVGAVVAESDRAYSIFTELTAFSTLLTVWLIRSASCVILDSAVVTLSERLSAALCAAAAASPASVAAFCASSTASFAAASCSSVTSACCFNAVYLFWASVAFCCACAAAAAASAASCRACEASISISCTFVAVDDICAAFWSIRVPKSVFICVSSPLVA